MKIIVSAEADSDLLHILNYLAARDQAAAVALAGLFNTKFKNLVFAFLSSGVSAPFLPEDFGAL